VKYQSPVTGSNQGANGEYIDGDPSTGTEGSVPPADAIEHPQREIVEVLTQLGLTPEKTDLTQLWQAVEKVHGKTYAGDPNGNVAADVLRERCWDTSQSPPQLYIATAADGTTTGTTWTLLAPDKYLDGHIDGLILSNNGTDANHAIDIAPGVAVCRDGNGNRRAFRLSSVLTKKTDADWAEGTNSGGFPSGLTLASNEPYHVFIIAKDDGTVDAGFDSDFNASNLLSDASSYTWSRRIGGVVTDGDGNIRRFSQHGDRFVLSNPLSDVYATDAPWTMYTIIVPAHQTAWLHFSFNGSGNQIIGYLRPVGTSWSKSQYEGGFKFQNADGAAKGLALRLEIPLNATSQIEAGVDGDEFRVRALGWIDHRGRD